jgi:predicted acetyltransferase
MSLEIREPRDDELDEVAYIGAYSFHSDRSPEALEHRRSLYKLLRTMAAYQNGRAVASLTLLSLPMAVNGGSQPFGGVCSVACLPEHRRRGYTGRLLTHALEMMHEDGQVLSGLYTPHFALYRRYGWMLAGRVLRYTFRPRDIALTVPETSRGEAMRVTSKEWARLDAVYRAFIARRNGYLHRSEQWWQQGVLRDFFDRRKDDLDVAVWVNGDDWRGYVVYEIKGWSDAGARLRVRDFAALDSDAYVGLVRYLLRHDLVSQLQWWTPQDDPLLSLLDDPTRVEVTYEPGMLLRVVDVAGAFDARPCLVDASGQSLTLELADEAAPWNAGCWRLEANAGHTKARKCKGSPDLSLDATVLAALFNGFLSPREAARGGLLKVHSESALAAADRIFAVLCPPFTADAF